MALVTYSDLKTQLGNWLARSDLTSNLDDFVTVFEGIANTRVGTRRMELTTTLTPDANGQATLPTDYLTWRNVTWQGSLQNTLEYLEPVIFSGRFPNPPGVQGQPVVAFTIIGNTLYVGPLDSTSLTLDYIGKISALSAGSNWLFTQHPQIYMFGALVEAYRFIGDMQKAEYWEQKRDFVFDDISRLDLRTKGRSGIRITGPVV